MYAVLDTETTGRKIREKSIIEIAIYYFDGKEITDRFISSKMLSRAPKFHLFAKRIVEITKDCILVGHNVDFDYRMLKMEFKRLGFDYERETLCTIELSKILIPDAPSYKLEKLGSFLKVPFFQKHRAYGDALATLEIFKLLLQKDSEKRILNKLLHKKKSNKQKWSILIDPLPDEIGVLYIYDKNKKIIYLKAAKNIQKQVVNLLVNEKKRAVELQKNIVEIFYETTNNYLIALLKEESEIEKTSPVFNEKTNYKKKIFPIAKYIKEDVVIINEGLIHNKNSFIFLEKGICVGYGYFSLNLQIENKTQLKRIMTPIKSNNKLQREIQNYINSRKKINLINIF